MTIYITELEKDNYHFPSSEHALSDPNGLLAFGGGLEPERILLAYGQGIFPWYGPGEPVLWWSPCPRAMFNPKVFQPAKSLKKYQKKHQYTVSINQATEQVIQLCASLRPAEETWLNEDMQRAYINLASKGHCHSVEVWHKDQLVGGLYGILRGKVFCGESMFSTATNASKVALWYFCQHFAQHGGEWIDCQVMNPHLASLGAIERLRTDFLSDLLSLKKEDVDAHCFLPQLITHTPTISDLK
ncbi:leucyl/phenylalanyl-tRNA--protein transferase [Vibrio sp. 10N.286.49.B3]|uniref:leucyl/phenylalanyl-tRNA--protein transferase n=1 Tax=Vibrio sp. 10N.286.49.B3 TaxID=1880855 RepID=UPI000C84A357|nr:leucyl/phenylalanyl-tRNA--protein transferase [Vibrio sp. 10N.286.49.B3]PMH45042.1 leucyl/phenylalanyl-tRNA--protein transferase [Vibrio sp. 10N.286.49.B3]